MPATDPSPPVPAPVRTPRRPRPVGRSRADRRRAGGRYRPLLLLVVTVLLAAPALAACDAGGSPDVAAGGTDDVEAGVDTGVGTGVGTGVDTGVDTAAVDPSSVAARASDRRVRYADVTLEVADVAAGAARVRRLAAEHGGYVSTEALGLREAGGATAAVERAGAPGPAGAADDVAPWPPVPPGQARLVLRLPQDRLDEAVAALAAVGTEIGRWTSEQVVEADLVDLDARVATATRSVARVRDLLAEAASLEDVLALEVEVARREADLEALRARRDALAGQAAQATLSVALTTPDASAAAGGAGFTGGLAAGWGALVAASGVALTALGAALPFVAVAAVVVVPLLLRSRRRRSRTAVA